jgi:hypothetical protein
LADGVLTCDEHAMRNEYNECPDVRPNVGTDANSVTWVADRFFFDLLANPFHPGLDCFRGTTDELGSSSYQCCYDGTVPGSDPGSFDFVNPFHSFFSTILHVWLDVLPSFLCND